MFDKSKADKKKADKERDKLLGIEEAAKPNLWGSKYLMVTGTTGLLSICVGVTGLITGSAIPVATLGVLTGGIASTIKTIRDLDIYAVGSYISGEQNDLTHAVFYRFAKTPLRFYTINHIARRVEGLEDSRKIRALRDEQKLAKKEAKNIKAKVHVDQASMQENRTVRYLKNLGDPGRHLRSIMYVVLGVFAGVRMMATTPAGMTTLKMTARVGAYAYGLYEAVSHIHTYIQKRAAETNPSPFFLIASHALRKMPTALLANWIVKRDIDKLNKLERGDQVWAWHAAKKVVETMPNIFPKKMLLGYVAESTMKITPAVIARLEEDGAMARLNDLKNMRATRTEDGVITRPATSLRTAYNELMARMDDRLDLTIKVYDRYERGIHERNAAKIELYEMFNRLPSLPMRAPEIDMSKVEHMDVIPSAGVISINSRIVEILQSTPA